MQFFNEEKDKKEIKSAINCIFCARQLNATELFYNANYCLICRVKYNLIKPNATLKDKIIK